MPISGGDLTEVTAVGTGVCQPSCHRQTLDDQLFDLPVEIRERNRDVSKSVAIAVETVANTFDVGGDEFAEVVEAAFVAGGDVPRVGTGWIVCERIHTTQGRGQSTFRSEAWEARHWPKERSSALQVGLQISESNNSALQQYAVVYW